MKIKKHLSENAVRERNILTGMIMSDRILREVHVLRRENMFSTKPSEIVADWCFKYFEKYGKAPRQHIQNIYEKARTSQNADDASMGVIQILLESLSDEFARAKKINSEYILDQAVAFFKERALKAMISDVQDHLLQGDVIQAEASVSGFKRVERIEGGGINPFTDEDTLFQAFEEDEEPLFILTGAVGDFLNAELVRDSFISILSPEKRGKTWLLFHLAKKAIQQHCNVAVFEVGDMSARQSVKRFGSMASGLPYRKKDLGIRFTPVLDCFYNQKDDCDHKHRTSRVGCGFDEEDWLASLDWTPEMFLEKANSKYRPCSHCRKTHPEAFKGSVWWEKDDCQKVLTWRAALKSGKLFMRGSGGKNIRLDTYPSDSISVPQIEARLDVWEKFDSFLADVVIIDYADLLKPSDKRMEYRHQINQTWKELRALSQKRHICLIVATQSDVKGHDVALLQQKNFSEDKRKLAHVTGMFGLNQTPQEKRKGVMRWNWIVLREGEFDITRTVTVLQDLRRGKAIKDSY